MPPSRRTRSLAAGEPVNIPADLDLDGLYVKDLRNLCNQLTTGTRSALLERLKEARRNANDVPPPVQNGGDNTELQQQFQQLQQQVQDLLNRNTDERMLFESQLAQVKSLVQATINETIEQTAAAAAQAAVNAFAGSSASQAAVLERNASSEGTVPSAVQDTLNSLAVDGASGTDTSNNSSASQQTLDSVHELPAKLVKEVLSAKYHRGLGWCVYDVKFRQEAAANKTIKWSVIDSQLWLKTFTVAPSLMKEDIGFFQSGPSFMPSTVRGNKYRTCHNFNKDIPVIGPPAPMHTSATSQVVEGIIPGSGAPPPPNLISRHHQGLGNPTVSNIAPATAASSFGGIVTPVNVLNLQHALSNHPNREFVNKLGLELREGARIGYSGPRLFRFSKNLPTASLNPEVVTEEVAKGRTVGSI